MTKGAALYQFFFGFGIPAYKSTSVPEDAARPYLTYEEYIGGWSDTVSITVQLFYDTDSEAIPSAKAQEIADAIGYGGKQIPCDGGTIWINMGNPFCQSMTDKNDSKIKRRYINLSADFNTTN